MSEDCHDSNNKNPFRVTRGDMWPDSAFRLWDDPTVLCAECGEPVYADEAYPIEIEHFNGTSEVAVFHKGFAKMCPLKWANKRLAAAAVKLNLILDNLKSPS